jgi:hypothetical protein
MRIKKILISGKVSEVPHPFIEEAGFLVHLNHSLLLESIGHLEQKEMSRLRQQTEDGPELHSELAFASSMADDLRTAANELALVSLVTRLQHSIRAFVEDISEATGETGLVKNLKMLNTKLGPGPENIEFFAGLVAVRDSVIHADSHAEWSYNGKTRRVPSRYVDENSGEIRFTEGQLREAVDLSIKQIEWYDKQLDRFEPNK